MTRTVSTEHELCETDTGFIDEPGRIYCPCGWRMDRKQDSEIEVEFAKHVIEAMTGAL